MASHSGNSNQFDMQKLFKPPNPSSNLNPNPNPNAPFLPPVSYTAGVSHLPYSTVQSPVTYTYPMPSPPFHHHPFIHYPQETLHRPVVSYSVQPSHPPNPNPSHNNPGQNPGARLMALLGNTPPTQLDFAASIPPVSAPTELPAMLHAVPSAPPAVMAVTQAQPARIPSTKMPRGRYLGGGERAVHDVESRATDKLNS